MIEGVAGAITTIIYSASVHKLSVICEDYVCRCYRQWGYQIVGRNIRHIGFELDIVALRDRELVIVEVKGRRRSRPGMAWHETLLSARKLQALRRGGDYLQTYFDLPFDSLRIDLALVTFHEGSDTLDLYLQPNAGF